MNPIRHFLIGLLLVTLNIYGLFCIFPPTILPVLQPTYVYIIVGINLIIGIPLIIYHWKEYARYILSSPNPTGGNND